MSASIIGARHKVLLDPPTAPVNGIQYIGFAQPNTATAEDAWAILRLTYVASDLSEVLWASGTNQFTRVWDDRASYVYS